MSLSNFVAFGVSYALLKMGKWKMRVVEDKEVTITEETSPKVD